MSAAFQNIGAISVLCGSVWFMWDHDANTPGWLLGGGLMCLFVGGLP